MGGSVTCKYSKYSIKEIKKLTIHKAPDNPIISGLLIIWDKRELIHKKYFL